MKVFTNIIRPLKTPKSPKVKKVININEELYCLIILLIIFIKVHLLLQETLIIGFYVESSYLFLFCLLSN